MNWWETLLGFLAGLIAMYLVLLFTLWIYVRHHPETISLKEALRLLPDVLRVIRRMAADKSVPGSVRIKLIMLLVYLLFPLDLVPDFLPVIGHADDLIILAMTLRAVIRSAGPAALRQHWPGTPAGLAIIEKLAGLPPNSNE
ncbi:YkvA family protein [Paeniglutamicibacter cryotolerans]|uniref:Uncharacterized membrane protein YkvA (DUF1232 family) n=1 Tax=Paeniglutamicibacter cryotolerans TaxID=670079 RepID=A0A839QUH5_9MICC|nr:DUF1232 domain-containing protein [Paeniglutamicibacter cryotolerans]MBB2997616.1 uncharacterized membrane protein YkvA (DUF1232 family) [Paeniglutamicibacter cryotolerans]